MKSIDEIIAVLRELETELEDINFHREAELVAELITLLEEAGVY